MMGAKGQGRKGKAVEITEPTPEQMRAGAFGLDDITDKGRGGEFVTIGKAYRRRRMVELLLAQGVIGGEDARALFHYRHHADIADRSPLRDSLNRRIGGGSADGPTVRILHARRVRDDCERAAMSLVDLLRAVVVDDMSLSQVAIGKAGGIEECYQRHGRTVWQIKPRRQALDMARKEFQFAAKRVRAELDAGSLDREKRRA